MSAVILAYLASSGSDKSFAEIKSAETKAMHRRTLERFSAAHGDKPFRLLDKIGVERVLATMKETPGAARSLRNVLRRLCRWAVAEKLIAVDPTEGITVTMPESDGWHTMDDAERAQYRAHHPIGTKARAVFEVLYWTALRVSDASRFGPQHVKSDPTSNLGVLHLIQHKTSHPVTQDVEAEMMEALDAYPKPVSGDNVAPFAFILNKFGKSYSAKGLGNAFSDWCDDAGLPHCSAHSVRKGTLTRIADRGGTTHAIAAKGGHKGLRMAEVYTRKADQHRLDRDNARLLRDEPETKVSNVPVAVDRKAKKA